jgi:hypothetical protein
MTALGFNSQQQPQQPAISASTYINSSDSDSDDDSDDEDTLLNPVVSAIPEELLRQMHDARLQLELTAGLQVAQVSCHTTCQHAADSPSWLLLIHQLHANCWSGI